MPALPGAQASAVTVGSCDRASTRACSRAPDPTTRTRTATSLDCWTGSAGAEGLLGARVQRDGVGLGGDVLAQLLGRRVHLGQLVLLVEDQLGDRAGVAGLEIVPDQ